MFGRGRCLFPMLIIFAFICVLLEEGYISSPTHLCTSICFDPILRILAYLVRRPCTYLYLAAPFKLKILLSVFTKQANLMRRSTVLNLPPQ
jgi:hypothetical protein